MSNVGITLKNLTEMGLSELEAKVYLALLPMEYGNIRSIAVASGVKRTSVYSVVETLCQKGLVSVREIGLKTFYSAEAPSHLKQILDRKVETLLRVLPDLDNLYINKRASSVVKYYEGVEALQQVYDTLLEELQHNQDYFVFGDPDHWDTHSQAYFKRFIKKRLKIKLKARLLLVCGDTAREYQKYQQNFGEEVRMLPENYALNVNAVIAGNKMIIHRLTSPVVTIVIEDPSVIAMQKNLFEIIWGFCS
jgi:sugar-specific transcriptional regulator TrmB